jgi:hypothetical protein
MTCGKYTVALQCFLENKEIRGQERFLQDRGSGQFLMDNRCDDWAFVSLLESSNSEVLEIGENFQQTLENEKE